MKKYIVVQTDGCPPHVVWDSAGFDYWYKEVVINFPYYSKLVNVQISGYKNFGYLNHKTFYRVDKE